MQLACCRPRPAHRSGLCAKQGSLASPDEETCRIVPQDLECCSPEVALRPIEAWISRCPQCHMRSGYSNVGKRHGEGSLLAVRCFCTRLRACVTASLSVSLSLSVSVFVRMGRPLSPITVFSSWGYHSSRCTQKVEFMDNLRRKGGQKGQPSAYGGNASSLERKPWRLERFGRSREKAYFVGYSLRCILRGREGSQQHRAQLTHQPAPGTTPLLVLGSIRASPCSKSSRPLPLATGRSPGQGKVAERKRTPTPTCRCVRGKPHGVLRSPEGTP